MRWSDERILTTHTGSLPRPPELTRLYVRRARGETIDSAELDRIGKMALRRIVDKQIEAGVDIGNNGEQQREAFFLYVRHRMSGFGGSWQRWPRGDVERYPLLKQQMAQMLAAREAVGNYQPPKAIGEVRYVDDTELNAEIADFRTALEAMPNGFVEPFMTAPSPGIIAAAMKNEYYDSEEAYLAAVAAAIQVEYEAIVKSGFLLQLDCPDLALERHLTYNDRPVGQFLAFVERVVAAINKAIVNVPRDRVRLHVCWGNYEGPHDRDVPLADILPLLEQANVGGFVLPFANPRHQHEYRVWQKFPLADDQIIAAGVIDDLTGFVEHPEVVADRLENVARAVGDPRRVMACTDCGFDTSAGMGRLPKTWCGPSSRPWRRAPASPRNGFSRVGRAAASRSRDYSSARMSASAYVIVLGAKPAPLSKRTRVMRARRCPFAPYSCITLRRTAVLSPAASGGAPYTVNYVCLR